MGDRTGLGTTHHYFRCRACISVVICYLARFTSFCECEDDLWEVGNVDSRLLSVVNIYLGIPNTPHIRQT